MQVTVVIPSYNHEKYVRQTILSVLNQTHSEIDLIVIDDGSSDNSPEVIADVHLKFGGFRYIARENRGLLHTLQEGLMLGRGEFFCEIASDDFFPPDSLEKRVEFLRNNPDYVAVFGDGISVRGENLTEERLVSKRRRQIFENKDPIPEMLQGALPIFSTGLIKRHSLLALGGFDCDTFRYYEDLDTPVLLSLHGQIGFIDAPVIYRRHHETNVSSSTNHIRVEKVLCYQKLLSTPAMKPYQRLLKRQLRHSLLTLGRYLDKVGGGTAKERQVFEKGWRYVLRDPRLLWYLIKMERRWASSES